MVRVMWEGKAGSLWEPRASGLQWKELNSANHHTNLEEEPQDVDANTVLLTPELQRSHLTSAQTPDSQELRDNNFMLFYATKSVVICYPAIER